MSDLDKLFESAPEGAVELAVYIDGDLRWATPSHTWSPNMKEWKDRPIEWKTIATRPETEQPRKTVEDAVEWANGVWPYRDCDAIAYNPTSESFGYYESRIGLNEKWYHVCNQSEFEACVAAKAKSKPEWTHTWNGNKCRVVFTEDYRSWIKGDALDTLVPTDSLKPIKPTITKAEQEMVAKFIARVWSKDNPDLRKEFDDFCNEHEVIE